jgi:hypothetical protein
MGARESARKCRKDMTDDDITPPVRGRESIPSDAAIRLRDAADILNGIALAFARTGGDIDELPPAERQLTLRRLCAHGHRTAKALTELFSDLATSTDLRV